MTDIFSEGAVESRVWIDEYLLQDEGITVLLSSEEPALPSMRNISVKVPGRHGAYDFGAYFEPREFTLNIIFPRQSYTDLKRQLRAFNQRFIDEYGRPKTVQLRFGDEVDKFYYVRLTSGVDIVRSANRGFTPVQLTAFDPFKYSLSEQIKSGINFIDFAVENQGSLIAKPIIKIKSMEGQLQAIDIGGEEEGNKSDNPILFNPEIIVNGRSTKLEGLIDSVTLDSRNYTAINELGEFVSDVSNFPYLNVGMNSITVSDKNGAIGFVEIIFRERWL